MVGNAEFIRFSYYFQRSATEVMSFLYVALDNSFIEDEKFKRVYDIPDPSEAC
jgi:hypothetical protein